MYDVAKILADNRPDEVLIAIPSASGEVRQRIVTLTREGNVPVNVKAGQHTVYWGDSLLLGGAIALAWLASERRIRQVAQMPLVEIVKGVASQLGNTPAVCRASYIDPRVFDRFDGGLTIGGVLPELAEDTGGFLVRDKLWFFGAYDRVHNTTDNVFGDLKSQSVSNRNLGSVKLTFHLSDSHSLVATGFQDPSTDTGAINDSMASVMCLKSI